MLTRLRSLSNAVYWSVRRLGHDGVPLHVAIPAAIRAALQGRRAFVHALMAYAAGTKGFAGAGGEPDAYPEWLRQQLPVPVPGNSGKVSIVIPVCNTPARFLREAVASVQAQTYSNWELCLHDDASDQSHVEQMLAEFQASIPNLRVSRSSHRGGIAAATNAALAGATGRWVAFLDHDDVLEPDALAAVVECHERTGAGIVYTDHDVLGDDGILRSPYFKPDWNHDLFLAQMYLGHLVSFERRLVEEVGGLRSDCDGAQDYDLVLRCVVGGASVEHVPKVLYHWRAHAGSTAASSDSKPYAHGAGKRAIQRHVDAMFPGARVEDGRHLFCYDVRYPCAEHGPLVSIIIPTRDGLSLLRACVESVLEMTDYPAYEIIVVDNGSTMEETLEWLAEMSHRSDFRVLHADIPFNWSALNNLGAREARGQVLVFLNNDTEVIRPDWLQRVAENSLRPDVGVCGSMLLYGDRSIQHAGVIVGMGGWADHVFKGQAAIHDQNLFVSPILQREVTAVTGACMTVARDKFELIGGFDEAFMVCGSDVELCIRAKAKGLATVYVAESTLIHHESKTRDPRAIPEMDFVHSAAAYKPFLVSGDPFFNRNLDRMSTVPALRWDP